MNLRTQEGQYFCVLSRQGAKTNNAGRNIANVDLAKMSNFKKKIKIRWVAVEMGIYFSFCFTKHI